MASMAYVMAIRMYGHENIQELICSLIPVGKINKRITVEEFIFSVLSGYAAWNRTKNKLLHRDFLLILPTGMRCDHIALIYKLFNVHVLFKKKITCVLISKPFPVLANF